MILPAENKENLWHAKAFPSEEYLTQHQPLSRDFKTRRVKDMENIWASSIGQLLSQGVLKEEWDRSVCKRLQKNFAGDH